MTPIVTIHVIPQNSKKLPYGIFSLLVSTFFSSVKYTKFKLLHNEVYLNISSAPPWAGKNGPHASYRRKQHPHAMPLISIHKDNGVLVDPILHGG